MIAEFSVENFLSIGSELKLSFLATKDKTNRSSYVTVMPDGTPLLKVAMIFGANNSGKSNLIRALELFRELFITTDTGSKWLGEKRRPFKLNGKYKDMATNMSLTFYFAGVKHKLSVSFDDDIIYDEVLSAFFSSRPTTIYHRTYRSYRGSCVSFNEKKIKLSQRDKNIIEDNTKDNCTVIAAYIKSDVGNCGLKGIYEYFRNGLGVLMQDEVAVDKVKQLLADKSVTKANDFLVNWMKEGSFRMLDNITLNHSGNSTALTFSYLNGGEIIEMEEEEESVGSIRFLAIGGLFFSHLKSNRLIIIDGLDIGLYPKLRRYVLRCFLKNSRKYSQLIFTTHALYVLDRNFIRRDAVWFAVRDADAESKLVRLSKCGLNKKKSAHKAFKKGEIIKLPDMGSTEINLEDFDIEEE